jgi:protein gp37
MLICCRHERNCGHAFQTLTKRADRMLDYLMTPGRIERIAERAGETMEDGDGWYDDILYRASVDHPNIWIGVTIENQAAVSRLKDLLRCPAGKRFVSLEPLIDRVDLDVSELDWVIVGGETGPTGRVRTMHPSWALLICERCRAASVPFFFKQWGPRNAGNLLDGRVWNETPALAGDGEF